MSDPTFRAIFANSVVSSFLLVKYKPDLLPLSRPSYLGSFVQTWTFQITIWLLWRVILYPKFFSPLRHLPGPKGGSFWNGQSARVFKESSGVPDAEWMRTIPHNGLLRYLSLFNSERIVVTSPVALAEVCTKNYLFTKPQIVTALAGRILGNGLVLAERDEHRKQRKLLMPAFTAKNIKQLHPTFWDKAKEVTNKMVQMVKEETLNRSNGSTQVDKEISIFEAGQWASRAALDVITLAALGTDFGAIQDPESDLNRTYRVVFEPTRLYVALALLKSILPESIVGLIPIKQNSDMDQAVKVIRKTCREVIHSKKEKMARNELEDRDLLTIILKGDEMKGVDEDAVIDQMMTLLAAGHETVSVGITMAIYMLCVHPEWQPRLRAEARAKFPSPGSEEGINSVNIDQMPYLNAFCSEVLRYWPPIPLTMREASADTTLLGEFIPKGTRLTINIIGTNRDELLWGPTGQSFRPERYLNAEGNFDASGGANTKYGNLSFMHGPRSCIAQIFARTEMLMIVAAWVGSFEFQLKNEWELDEKNVERSGGSLSAKPVNGIWVKAKVVEGW